MIPDESSARAAYYARTMHKPDDPEHALLRTRLRETSRLLIGLHRTLIQASKEEYALAVGPVGGPTDLLRLLNDDPFFGWLKPMTALIVSIDEMARTDFELADGQSLLERVEALVSATGDPAFTERYVPLLQSDTEITISHASLRQSFRKA